MGPALARHDALLREHVAAHQGVVFKTTGDGLHAAFVRPSDALAAALAAQRALRVASWGEIGPLRVRMAIHTGVVEVRDGDYFGPPVNRAARLLAAGHGGQVLLSGAAEALVREQLSDEVGLRSLGAHRLKDLSQPEHIFQLTAADLPDTFPALRTLSAQRSNLPAQPTPLVARERELQTLCEWLADPEVRLLTLTGPGGIGKTRLALQVAADTASSYADGVIFVDLAPIREARLVVPSIARTLGTREVGGQPLLTRLRDELWAKHLLLLLDNFEQVVDAAPQVAELLGSCPSVKALVTSRQALRLRAEREFPVPPLPIPDCGNAPADSLSRYGATALFVQRARAVKPDFTVTDETAATIAAICQRLDGLPLAIELAAVRTRLLPPAALLARLEHSLPLLTSGPRDLPARQQALRSTIAWSYDLLNAGAQALLRRLAVFVGGCTIAAAEGVCNPARDLGMDVLDGLNALVDQSMLRQVAGAGDEPRFVMLETIREYALERLVACDELEQTGRRHVTWYLELAQAAEPALTGPQQQQWLVRLEQEHSNLRAAIQWALDRGEAEIALRFCAALWKFWQFHGHYGDGARLMEAALAQDDACDTPLRAQVQCGAGWLTFSARELARAQSWFDASLALARALGDSRTIAMALHGVGQLAQLQRDYARAQALYEESLALFRQLSDAEEVAWSLHHLGKLANQQGDQSRAAALFEECLALFRRLGHTWGESLALRHLGYLTYRRGELDQATTWYHEGLKLSQAIGDRASAVATLGCLAEIASMQGDYARAAVWFVEGLRGAHELRDNDSISWCLTGLVGLVMASPRPEQAAQLLGAVSALLDALGIQVAPPGDTEWERCEHEVQAQLDATSFATAWAAGRGMTVEQALSASLEQDGRWSAVATRRLRPPP